MKLNGKTVLACTCRGTMPLEAASLARACATTPGAPLAHELCRADHALFRDALATGAPLLVACTQEAPAFRETHTDQAATSDLAFVNIRESANWSPEARQALPKTAALLAAATLRPPTPDTSVALRSAGVTVIYGTDDRAVEAAQQLRDRLDLTVIIAGTAPIRPPLIRTFPIVHGTITRLSGWLGAFDLVVDDFAEAAPSSRQALVFENPRNGARSRCDLVIDLSGGTPLLAGHHHREGYLRASPDDPVAVQRLLFQASDLVGDFSKPRHVALLPDKCAHARNGQVGCTRCLDVCPAGAITPNGDVVAIEPHICAGCGQCAAVCPTTAVRLAAPGAESLARQIRTLLATYHHAGGVQPPVLLLHDADHGAPLIDTLARHGDGLPARVIPLPFAGQPGLDTFASALAFGAADLRILTGAKNQERIDATTREIDLLDALTLPLGHGSRLALIATDDPFTLGEALAALPPRPGLRPAAYLPTGDKIALANQALAHLHQVAPTPLDAVPLPPGAPIGTLEVDTAGCTLCLSCVSVCPTSALRAHAESPMLKFVEDLCVQCGLCATTCPEHVIRLQPRATFGAPRRQEIVIKQEQPALCIRCAKPFGVQSVIDKIAADLANKHWMFKDPAVVDRIRMCADCRIIEQTRRNLDPYAGPPRPTTRTTEDYR